MIHHPYRVKVVPNADVWMLSVVGLPGQATAVDLRDSERIARKFISLHTGAPLNKIRLVLEIIRVPRDAVRPCCTGSPVLHGPHAAARWVRARLNRTT